MAEGATTPPRSPPTPSAQARLEHAGGYNWRERDQQHAARPRLPRRAPRPQPGDVLAAASSRAPRWPARWPATPTCCCSTSRPTTSTSSRSSGSRATCRRSTPPSCWWRTTAGSSRRSAPRCSSSRPAAARFFKGTWHAWRKEKAARELALGRAIEKQEAEIERLERFVDRFRAGTRARQAQSRVKKLEKMERVTRDPRDGKALGFAFKPPERSGRVVFEVEDGDAEDRRAHAARRRRAVARARRARVADRPQRRRARRR